MIGIGEPAHLTETTGALHAFNIPLVSVVPPRTSSLLTSSGSGNQIRSSYSNMLTTAPDMAGQARVWQYLYKHVSTVITFIDCKRNYHGKEFITFTGRSKFSI